MLQPIALMTLDAGTLFRHSHVHLEHGRLPHTRSVCTHTQRVHTHTEGSFMCACHPRYPGTGATCSDDDECTSHSDNRHTHPTSTNTTRTLTWTQNPGRRTQGTAELARPAQTLDRRGCAHCEYRQLPHPGMLCETAGSFARACNLGCAGSGAIG